MKGSNSTRTALRSLQASTSTSTSTSTLLPRVSPPSILSSVGRVSNNGTTNLNRCRANLHTTSISRQDDWDPLTASRIRLKDKGGTGGSRSRFGGGFSREPLSASWYAKPEPVVETADKKKKQQNDYEFPRNESIALTSEYVRLVNPETSRLDPDPVSVADLLANLDRGKRDLVQVTPMAQLERSRLTNPDFTPIVRIHDYEAEEKQRVSSDKKAWEQKKNRAGLEDATKKEKEDAFEVQLTWGTTEHDLGHKLKRPKQYLSKKPPGTRVRIIVGTKRGKKYASGSDKEKEALMEEIENLMAKDSADGGIGDMNVRVRREGPISWAGGLLKIRAEMELVSY